jgi:hypothetical protein
MRNDASASRPQATLFGRPFRAKHASFVVNDAPVQVPRLAVAFPQPVHREGRSLVSR